MKWRWQTTGFVKYQSPSFEYMQMRFESAVDKKIFTDERLSLWSDGSSAPVLIEFHSVAEQCEQPDFVFFRRKKQSDSLRVSNKGFFLFWTSFEIMFPEHWFNSSHILCMQLSCHTKCS